MPLDFASDLLAGAFMAAEMQTTCRRGGPSFRSPSSLLPRPQFPALLPRCLRPRPERNLTGHGGGDILHSAVRAPGGLSAPTARIGNLNFEAAADGGDVLPARVIAAAIQQHRVDAGLRRLDVDFARGPSPKRTRRDQFRCVPRVIDSEIELCAALSQLGIAAGLKPWASTRRRLHSFPATGGMQRSYEGGDRFDVGRCRRGFEEGA